MTVSDVGLVAL